MFPAREKFFNVLSSAGVCEGDYETAEKVLEAFNCRAMFKYLEVYMEMGVLLLAESVLAKYHAGIGAPLTVKSLSHSIF